MLLGHKVDHVLESHDPRSCDHSVTVYNLVQFWKNKKKTILLIITFSKGINAINLAFILKLGLKICSIDIKTPKLTLYY